MSLIKSYHKQTKRSLTHLGSGCGSWHHSWTHWIAHSLWKFLLTSKRITQKRSISTPEEDNDWAILWIHQKCFFVLKWEKKCMIRLASRDNSTLLFCNYAIKLEEKTENEKHDTFDGTCVQFETDEHELSMNWSEVPLRKFCEQINLNLYIQKATKLLKPFASCRYLEVWYFYTEFCVFHPDLILLCPPVCSSIPRSVSEDSPVSPGSCRISGTPSDLSCDARLTGLPSIPAKPLETRPCSKEKNKHKRFIIWTRQQQKSCLGEHGKVHQKWMCYTNPFTGPETWAGFEVSHSYPFCLILLCQRSQAAPRRMWSARGELSFHRLLDWARRWLSWPFCVPGRSGSGPGLSGRFRCFVWPGSVSTPMTVSHLSGRDPPFQLPLLASCDATSWWSPNVYENLYKSSVNKCSF